MYRYDQYDHLLVRERVAQFRDQVQRRQSGELTEEEFLPLRLQNGLYQQKHAYMLRVAIPYGVLASDQLRALAHIARAFDKGYGHFTTRQNIQFNWIQLEQAPDILEYLASAQMHAIQTSGNCVRNVTTEAFAGVAEDEIIDPRPLAELLRQWSTVNPEFLFLPRKFKIAISAAAQDRAAIKVHDIGLHAYLGEQNELLLRIYVGGGLGRTPIIGIAIKDNLAWNDMLSYVEAILRVYNRHGRRDNKYKARIKILVKALGIDAFAAEVEQEWSEIKSESDRLTEQEFQRIAANFAPPAYAVLDAQDLDYCSQLQNRSDFARWAARNIFPHKIPGYSCVSVSTKPGLNSPPGDVSAQQMDALADLADEFSFGELRVAHEQNLVLPNVRKSDLFSIWQHLQKIGLATPNIGLLTDIIACPGGDYCSLANAKSIPIAQGIQQRFDNLDYLHDLGDISLNISGCMNACGHHHIGNIGILGVDKGGAEFYQVTLGGSQGNQATLGKVVGPAFSAAEIPEVIEKIVYTYTAYRELDEPFYQLVNRIGLGPFKERLYQENTELSL